MTTNLHRLELAVGTVGAVIASEHFFSTLLSSPWTTQKFIQTEEEKNLIRRMYFLASMLSLGFAVFICHLIKEEWPAIVTFGLCCMYIVVYEKSMVKTL